MDDQSNGNRPAIPTWVWILAIFAIILGLQLWLSGRFSGPDLTHRPAQQGGHPRLFFIHIETGRGRKDLRIAGPAKAFIPLWTIGGHIDKVTFLPPDNIVLQLVY